MNRSKWLRGSALAAVLALAASACSLRPPDGVKVTQVPINLVFGAEIPDEFIPEQPSLAAIPPAAVLELPPPPPPPLDEDVGPLCPPLKQNAVARDVAEPNVFTQPVTAEQNKDKGNFLFRWHGTIVGPDGKTKRDSIKNGPYEDHKKISNVEPARSGKGFFFDMDDPFVGSTISFTVIPLVSGEKDHGIYFKRIFLPSRYEELIGGRAEFLPAKPSEAPPAADPDAPPPDPQELAADEAASVLYDLKMLDFPIKTGQKTTQAAPNTAFNIPTGRNDNTGAPLLRPAAMTIRSTVEVGERDLFEVCDTLAQGWRINWTLQGEGDYNWTMIGTFWLGTQYGGFPIKEEYLLISDDQLISGNVSSTLMKVDPGVYV